MISVPPLSHWCCGADRFVFEHVQGKGSCWHSSNVMPLSSIPLYLLALFAALSQAIPQERAFTRDWDQVQVRRFIQVINDSLTHPDRQLLSTLITNDTEVWTGTGMQTRGAALLTPLLIEPQFWSETTVPQLMNEAIRVLSPALVILNAELVQYGTLGRVSTPAVIILRRKHGDWRISFFGLFPHTASLPPWRPGSKDLGARFLNQ